MQTTKLEKKEKQTQTHTHISANTRKYTYTTCIRVFKDNEDRLISGRIENKTSKNSLQNFKYTQKNYDEIPSFTYT